MHRRAAPAAHANGRGESPEAQTGDGRIRLDQTAPSYRQDERNLAGSRLSNLNSACHRYFVTAKNLNLIVCGVGGRMGGAVVRAIQQTPGVELIGGIDKPGSPRLGKDAGEISAAGNLGITVTDKIEPYLKPGSVIVDFTQPDAS